jgi:hypothetical protein
MKRFFLLLLMAFFAGCNNDDDKQGVCELNKIESSFGAAAQRTFDVFYTEGKISAVRATDHTNSNQEETWFIDWAGDDISHFFYQIEGSANKDHFYYTYNSDHAAVNFYKVNGTDTVATSESNEFYIAPPAAGGMYYVDGSFYEVTDGNVIRSGFYDVVDGVNVINPGGQVTYTYDARENEMRHLARLPNFLLLGFQAARVNSKNNMVAATFTNDNVTKEFTFTYDDGGHLLNFLDKSTGHQLAFSYNCK